MGWKRTNFGWRIAVAQGQIYKIWGLLLLIYLFGVTFYELKNGFTIYEILYFFWQTTTKTRNKAEQTGGVFPNMLNISNFGVPNNNQSQIILLIAMVSCLDEKFLRIWQIWIPWSLLGPHKSCRFRAPILVVKKRNIWKSGHRSAGCSRCWDFLGHWLDDTLW